MHPEVQPVLGPSPRAERLWLLALLAALALSLGFRLGDTPIDSKREARTWYVMQGMVESGDWLVPRVQGEVRLVKPPLFYWTSSAAAELLGGADRFALRLPSLLAAVAMVWLTWAWGRSVGGPAVGLVAAGLLVMMHLTVSHGRRGVAEMQLALFANCALFVFDRMLREGRRLLPLFALCTALAVLSKATTALMLIGVPIFVWLMARKRLRAMVRLPVLAWVSVGVLAGFAWYFVILAVVPGAWDTLSMAASLPLGVKAGEAAATATHYEPFWYYVPKLVLDTMPGILLLPLAVAAAVRTRFWADDPRRMLLGLVFVTLFIAFSMVPQKQKHYLIPLLPALTILMADAGLSLFRRDPGMARRVMISLAVLGTLVGLFLLTILVIFYADILASRAWAVGAGIAVGLGLIAACLRAAWGARPLRMAALCVAATLALTTVNYGSLDLWKEQFEAGTVHLREDYDAERWERAFERYPMLRNMIGENRRGDLGAAGDG